MTHSITLFGNRGVYPRLQALEALTSSIYSDILSQSIYRENSVSPMALSVHCLLIFQSLIQVDIFPILQIRTLKFRKLKFFPKLTEMVNAQIGKL